MAVQERSRFSNHQVRDRLHQNGERMPAGGIRRPQRLFSARLADV